MDRNYFESRTDRMIETTKKSGKFFHGMFKQLSAHTAMFTNLCACMILMHDCYYFISPPGQGLTVYTLSSPFYSILKLFDSFFNRPTVSHYFKYLHPSHALATIFEHFHFQYKKVFTFSSCPICSYLIANSFNFDSKTSTKL